MPVLSGPQVAQVARDEAGLTGEPLVIAVAIAKGESGWNTAAQLVTSREDSRGLWQVNTFAHPSYDRERLFEAAYNGRAMRDISAGGTNWRPWTVFTSGKYLTHMAEARAAVATLGNTNVASPDADGRVEIGPTGPPPAGSLVIGGRILQPALLRVSGETIFADASAVRAHIERDVDEADRITVEVSDPKRELLRNRLLSEKSTLTIDGVLYELTDIAKFDSLLTLTFTDAAAVDLNRPVTATVTQAPGVATRGDFMRRLVELAPWVRADIEPGLTTQVPLALGTASQPDETPWQALGRLAREVEWRRCAVANRVLVGSDEWLASRAEPIPIAEFQRGVDSIDFRSNFGVRADEATVTCKSALWVAPPSTAVTVSGVGFGDGEWLVQRFERELTATRATVTLTRVRPALNEPTPPPEPTASPDPGPGEGASYGMGETVNGPPGNVATGAVSASGLSWPLSGRVTSGYGSRTHPVTGAVSFHAGIDIAAATGTEVRAAHSGTVIEVGRNDIAGLYVRLSGASPELRTNVTTRYLHLNSAQVREGQTVVRGEQIALSGASGRVTGPHLHFEVKVAGVLRDPRDLLP